MYPVLHDFDLFGFLRDPWSLHTYGVLIAIGFMAAMNLAKRQSEREGEDPERIVDLAFYVLLAGLIGSRFVFIMTKLEDYTKNPIEIFMFWRGGLVWYGGFIAATGYVWWYCRKHRLNFLKYADLCIPYVALAHAFGRLGCLAAGCCFGKPSDMPWAIVFPNSSMAQQAQQHERLVEIGASSLPVHPTQLYEAGFEMAMFWLLLLLRPHKRFHGQLMLVWLAVYPVARSIIEMFRGDKERGIWLLGLSTSQWLSVLVAGAAVWLYWHLRRSRVATPAVAAA
jgi:phosphatidylglycerol---prolipoprotein diacylglyceryl transferase